MTYTPDLHELAILLKAAADQRMDRTTGQVAAAWSRAWDEIAQEWREALEDLAATAEDGQWPSRTQINRAARAQGALNATAQALDVATREMVATLTGDLEELVRLAEQHQQQMITGQLPNDYRLPTVAFTPEAVAAMVDRSSARIVALSLPLAAEAQAAMRSALIRGMAVGDNPRAVARAMLTRVKGVFEGGLARAENIARTEMVDAMRAAALQARTQHADILAGWAWTAKLDAATCPSCVAMHGEIFPLDAEGPLDHPSGRCIGVPVVRPWSELGFDIEEPPSLPAQTGPEWFIEQPEQVQREILGPKRFAAWQRGDYPPEAWAVLRNNPDWRPSYGLGPLP